MARQKETIWQKDFSLGSVRPEAEEQDEIPLIERSCRRMTNMITLSTGQMEGRPGTVHAGSTEADRGYEVDLGEDRRYDLHIVPDGVILYDEDDQVEYTGNLTWTAVPRKYGTYEFESISFWLLSDPDSGAIFIGSNRFPIQALVRDEDGNWSFGQLNFQTGLNGAIRQPYWRYYEGVTVQPSARTGAITLTASEPIWKAAHEGMAIRYGDREIILGTLVSTTVINATVTEELPPTWEIEVASASNYKVGDAVEHSLLGGEGIITDIDGTTITVFSTSKYDGFDANASAKLVAPNAAQVISSVTEASTPAATGLWDMQMQSAVHGYAGYAARHLGRTFLCDFPGAPQGFAVSVAGTTSDFFMGPDDADGFVESVGADSGGALKFIVSSEDLLFLTTRGLYYQQTRDGTAITPQTIRPVRFSRKGCNRITPVAVDDGCVFVDAVGQQVQAAVLAGDIYKSWRVQDISKYHSHLINRVDYIGATASGSETPESFIYIINRDGTAAVCQWDRENDVLAWKPWETEGDFRSMYQCFGKTYAVVDRLIAGVPRRFRERFEFDVVLDCVAAVRISEGNPEGYEGANYFGGTTAFATHLEGHTGTVWLDGWDIGDYAINAAGKPVDGSGAVIDYPDYAGIAQVGLVFAKRIVPWSRRSVRTQRGTRAVKRLVEIYVTVQNTTEFEITGVRKGGYRTGEDMTVPPPRRAEQFRETFVGKGGFDRTAIEQNRPGFLRILKLGFRVTV